MHIATISTLVDRHRGLVLAIVLASIAALTLLRALSLPERLALTWDILATVFLATAWTGFLRSGTRDIRTQAASYNVSDIVILLLCLFGVAASLVTLFRLVTNSEGLTGDVQQKRMGLAVLTVVLSWFFLHTVLALHYAHSYFVQTANKTDSGGLEFPSDEIPDYFDFLYFAFVIGATSQTSDVSITAKPIRRLALLHGIAAFAFNTVLLALTVNAAASLFQAGR